MVDREAILRRINNPDDKLMLSKVLDKAVKAEKVKKTVYTDFLDPRQKNIVEACLENRVDVEYRFDGGYTGAEREILIFDPCFISGHDDEYYSYDDVEDTFLKLIRIKHAARDKLSHRDYLGALMGLGIKREKFGDIIVGDESCSVVALKDIAGYIADNLLKVGKAGVSTEITDISEIEAQIPSSREIKTTVASLRLDCISGAGFGISRSKAADFIKSERVNLNWDTTTSITRLVNEGDVISIRGKGRVEVESIGGTTRKNRISIVLKMLK